MAINDIYGLRPINRTAGLVTGQAGCTTELTDEQIRENLVAQLKALMAENETLKKGDPRKKIVGKLLSEKSQEINAVRPKKKLPGVENYFIDVARENLSAFEFKRWMNVAAERMRSEQDKN